LPIRTQSPAAVRNGAGHPLAAVLLGVLIIALVVVAGVVGLSLQEKRDAERQRTAALRAARQTAVNLSSLDHKQVQPSIDRVLSGLTGTAKDNWASQSKTLAETLTKARSVSTAQSVRAGVVSIDGDSAEVIVAVTALTTMPKVPQGSPRDFRYRMALTHNDGRWLVSDLGLIP
jgi:Mce-associated membrane protein